MLFWFSILFCVFHIWQGQTIHIPSHTAMMENSKVVLKPSLTTYCILLLCFITKFSNKYFEPYFGHRHKLKHLLLLVSVIIIPSRISLIFRPGIQKQKYSSWPSNLLQSRFLQQEIIWEVGANREGYVIFAPPPPKKTPHNPLRLSRWCVEVQGGSIFWFRRNLLH